MSGVGKLFNAEQFVAQATVEALSEAVLPRTTWFNVKRLDSKFRQPVSYRLGNKLRAIVAANMLRHAVHHKQLRQPIDDVSRLKATRYIQCDTAASEFINDDEPFQGLSTLCTIKDEIPTPNMIRMCRSMTMACVGSRPQSPFFSRFLRHF